MSSWRKTAKLNQRPHRERHQLACREHLGFLEKKKDYVNRAREYSNKKKVLKTLKRHAQNRNPDEFNYHMINSQIKDGIHEEKRKPESEETEQQKLVMDNRTLSYVNMKRTIEHKKIDRLQAGLHLVDLAENISKHVYYDKDGNELDDPEKLDPEPEEKPKQIKPQVQFVNHSNVDRINKVKEIEYKTLARRIERHNQLAIIQRKMEVTQALKKPAYEKPKLIKQGTKTEAAVYKWKYERKR